MNEKFIFSQTNDPLRWSNEDYEVITFASMEDAKKAERMFHELQIEIKRLREYEWMYKDLCK